jgi:hypothetical protein
MKPLKHASNLTNFPKDALTAISLQEIEVIRQPELTFQLRQGAQADSKEAAQFDVSLTSAALSDVCCD